MRAFSIGSKYISNLIAGLNLTAIAMLASAPNPIPGSTSNTTLPSTISRFSYAAYVIPTFLVIVKPAFIKYLKETSNVFL